MEWPGGEQFHGEARLPCLEPLQCYWYDYTIGGTVISATSSFNTRRVSEYIYQTVDSPIRVREALFVYRTTSKLSDS